jgi:hypothetical protein
MNEKKRADGLSSLAYDSVVTTGTNPVVRVKGKKETDALTNQP